MDFKNVLLIFERKSTHFGINRGLKVFKFKNCDLTRKREACIVGKMSGIL